MVRYVNINCISIDVYMCSSSMWSYPSGAATSKHSSTYGQVVSNERDSFVQMHAQACIEIARSEYTKCSECNLLSLRVSYPKRPVYHPSDDDDQLGWRSECIGEAARNDIHPILQYTCVTINVELLRGGIYAAATILHTIATAHELICVGTACTRSRARQVLKVLASASNFGSRSGQRRASIELSIH